MWSPDGQPDMTELQGLNARQNTISEGVGDHPCFLTFLTMIPNECKLLNTFIFLLFEITKIIIFLMNA